MDFYNRFSDWAFCWEGCVSFVNFSFNYRIGPRGLEI